MRFLTICVLTCLAAVAAAQGVLDRMGPAGPAAAAPMPAIAVQLEAVRDILVGYQTVRVRNGEPYRLSARVVCTYGSYFRAFEQPESRVVELRAHGRANLRLPLTRAGGFKQCEAGEVVA